jgi:hypothetical protein
MENATERRVVYALCLAGGAVALAALYLGLARSDVRVIGVALALVGLLAATAIAAWRSGRPGEAGEDGAEPG